MIRYRFYALLLLATFSINCHRAPATKEFLTIQKTQSPTDGDSREPELTTSPNGQIILSWVERLGEKRYALRTAILEQDQWTEPRTVAEGENWFVRNRRLIFIVML